MSKSRKPHDPKSKGKARVSNGEALLPGVSKLSATYRRYRDLATAIAVDQGGADHLSETRLQLIRRFAATCVLAEQHEAAMARGEPFDLGEFCNLASTTVRLAARIGLSRSPRIVTPSLEQYLQKIEPPRPEPEPVDL